MEFFSPILYKTDNITLIDFDFDAIGNPDSEWMQRYLRITKAIEDLPFLLFPFLDNQRFARLVPRRRRAHQDVDAFLAMIDGVIERKRASLKEAGRDLATVPQSEKDLLTLLIEAESNENGYMTNEELRVSKKTCMGTKTRSLICYRAMHVPFLLQVMKLHRQLYQQSCTILQHTRYIYYDTLYSMVLC